MTDSVNDSHPPATTDATWQTDVLSSPVPVLVDFWAPWCGPCRVVGPVVEEIYAESGGKFKVFKLNVDENMTTSQTYGIMSIPTLMVFVNGQAVESSVGVKDKADVVAMLLKHATADASPEE